LSYSIIPLYNIILLKNILGHVNVHFYFSLLVVLGQTTTKDMKLTSLLTERNKIILMF
jgi:hypothetical protein